MTVISEAVDNIVGADDRTTFEFATLVLRESDDGTGLVTTTPYFVTAVDGVLTTPDLEAGPAQVRVGQRAYRIEIPGSETAVRLWPLIQAGLPVSPTEEATAVRNGGHVRRIQRLTESEYLALATPDPETLYVTVED